MKILEAQSAVLTNYEVYTHLTEQRKRYTGKGHKGRRPGNLETIVRELLDYLNEAPSPLGSHPFPYNERTITTLLSRLRQWDFTKAEMIMILNLRPTKPESLNTIVEEMEARFPGDDLQYEICAVIAEVLGRPDGEAERQAMTDNAAEARNQQQSKEAAENMEVDGEGEGEGDAA